MTFSYDKGLETLLSSIEAKLVVEVPLAVDALKISQQVYALFLWYEDSSTADSSPSFGIGTTAVLDACAKQNPSDMVCRVECTWSPQQNLEDHTLIRRHALNAPDLRSQCQQAYSLMLAANKTGLPLPNESEILMPFRSMMRRVAKRLNESEWPKSFKIDVAFVVVALSMIGEWLDDDLRASIPRTKFKLLQQKGMLTA